MVSKTDSGASGTDTAKIALSLFIVVAAVVAYYWFGEQPLLYRVIGLLVAMGASIALFVTTAKGLALWSFLKDSRTEARRVIWPTNQETMQTTLIVMLIVFIVGLFLWLLDMLLAYLFTLLTGI